MSEPRRIRNGDDIAPGTLVVRAHRGQIVFEVIETRMDSFYLKGRLRNPVSGRSVGWQYLDEFRIVDGGES